MTRHILTPDEIRHKLLGDLFDLRIWYRSDGRFVTPGWHKITVEECDVLKSALRQWKPDK